MNGGAWAVVAAALIAAVLAPWVKARIDKRNSAVSDGVKAKADLAVTVDKRLDRLLSEQDRLRDSYRSEVDDLRARVRLLEQEVAEWRSGLHGVIGVWVAVPSSVWEYVRSQLPDLPSTRFPGEIGATPHDE